MTQHSRILDIQSYQQAPAAVYTAVGACFILLFNMVA